MMVEEQNSRRGGVFKYVIRIGELWVLLGFFKQVQVHICLGAKREAIATNSYGVLAKKYGGDSWQNHNMKGTSLKMAQHDSHKPHMIDSYQYSFIIIPEFLCFHVYILAILGSLAEAPDFDQDPICPNHDQLERAGSAYICNDHYRDVPHMSLFQLGCMRNIQSSTFKYLLQVPFWCG